jgi:hypothetical protein
MQTTLVSTLLPGLLLPLGSFGFAGAPLRLPVSSAPGIEEAYELISGQNVLWFDGQLIKYATS